MRNAQIALTNSIQFEFTLVLFPLYPIFQSDRKAGKSLLQRSVQTHLYLLQIHRVHLWFILYLSWADLSYSLGERERERAQSLAWSTFMLEVISENIPLPSVGSNCHRVFRYFSKRWHAGIASPVRYHHEVTFLTNWWW